MIFSLRADLFLRDGHYAARQVFKLLIRRPRVGLCIRFALHTGIIPVGVMMNKRCRDHTECRYGPGKWIVCYS